MTPLSGGAMASDSARGLSVYINSIFSLGGD
jgi:hypothetical protein